MGDAMQDILSGGGEEVNLEDDVPSIASQTKLEFKTPEEEFPVENKQQPAELLVNDTSPSSQPRTELKVVEEEQPYISVSVSNPTKVGDGMNAYVTYKVSTRTNMNIFKKKSFSTNRRFSDFLGLHEKLAEKHLHLGRIVPPAPQKDALGTTKVKMSKDESLQQVDFIEKRRAALERFLMRTAAHPVLRTDQDFREFLELEAELPKASNTSVLSGAGFARFFSRVGDTVAKITLRMDESDPVSWPLCTPWWFEDKQQQVENLDMQMRRLYTSVESLVQHRRDLCIGTDSFSKSVAMLGNSEEHSGLSRALAALAEVEERVEQTQSRQATRDAALLAELLKDYLALVGAVKAVFHQRAKVYQTWQHAQSMLSKRRENKARLELAGKHDKVAQAREEVVEWEAKVERGQEEFENISKMIRQEVERFEKDRVIDFKDTLVQYLETLLETQQQVNNYTTFLNYITKLDK
ncbi:SNX2 [Cordylochernes scorpioides]|uniref:SNX2 n=1 Tax=Cordylochernes scorpioides TaxID=51811 RepID=A0ABY6LAI5_9ARAC|nr:SNX2 [Cordylochernes scorpioides]